jgi:hypothetical protein
MVQATFIPSPQYYAYQPMKPLPNPYVRANPCSYPTSQKPASQQKPQYSEAEVKHETVDVQAANILLSVSPKFGPMKPGANPSPLDLLADFALDGGKAEQYRPMSNSLRALNLEMRSSTTIPDVFEQYKDIYNKNGRIGIYTRKERDAIIARFKDKRNRRVWKKKIRYGCRKNLADRRIRIKGRFVRSDEQEAAIGMYEKPPKERRSTM